jgi:hypothetical protein
MSAVRRGHGASLAALPACPNCYALSSRTLTFSAIAVTNQTQQRNEKLARMTEEELAVELKRRGEASGLEITVKPINRDSVRRLPDREQPFERQVPALAGGGVRFPNHD